MALAREIGVCSMAGTEAAFDAAGAIGEVAGRGGFTGVEAAAIGICAGSGAVTVAGIGGGAAICTGPGMGSGKLTVIFRNLYNSHFFEPKLYKD